MIVWGGNKKNRLAQPSNQFRNERNESVIIKQNWKRNWLKKREQKKMERYHDLAPHPIEFK